MSDEAKLDTWHYLASGVAVSVVAGAAGWLSFTYHLTTTSKFWLAAINLVTGLVIVSLLIGVVPKVVRPANAAQPR